MVDAGREYLEKGDVDKAIHTFQEAVNVDSENGVAYFFLAKALVQTESYDDALGLLDRADELLNAYPDWHKEVLQLKADIENFKQNADQQKGTEKGGYY